MEFELVKIDPRTCSIEELDKEISRLKHLKEEYYNLEQSIKIFINSIYGGVGSPWFECYNVALAEAVTLQGQDMIHFSNDILDDYFLNYWHLDKKLHDALGLTDAKKI
jgi:DNA polymerase elongation subunit (family B)